MQQPPPLMLLVHITLCIDCGSLGHVLLWNLVSLVCGVIVIVFCFLCFSECFSRTGSSDMCFDRSAKCNISLVHKLGKC